MGTSIACNIYLFEQISLFSTKVFNSKHWDGSRNLNSQVEAWIEA